MQQRCAEFSLQPFDLLRHGRLGQMQLFGGPAEARQFRDNKEGPQRP